MAVYLTVYQSTVLNTSLSPEIVSLSVGEWTFQEEQTVRRNTLDYSVIITNTYVDFPIGDSESRPFPGNSLKNDFIHHLFLMLKENQCAAQ